MSKDKKPAAKKNSGKTKSARPPARPAARGKARALVIVESPTKTKSLSKFLGKDYIIESSKGHVIDLPKSSMGIDVGRDFAPHYITIRGKGKTLADLKRAAKRADEVLLATDPDREGEAISWHLQGALADVNPNIKRIEFNEITQTAVLDAIAHPRDIDTRKVDSQQARRVLDRLVGYSISPVLQEKFGSRRFSAGRVQSASLKILCDREAEIRDFVPVEYWEFEGFFQGSEGDKKNKATAFRLHSVQGQKPVINNTHAAMALEEKIRSVTHWTVAEVSKTERRIRPQAPYITSRLQQDASTRLGFRAQKTMSVAQSLYEGVELQDGNVTGLITYMRTDSTRISEQGLQMARAHIAANYPEGYLPAKPKFYSKKAAAQDAHEAIRPTMVDLTPEKAAGFLSPDQLKLYSLIWRRFIASQMTEGIDEVVTIRVESAEGQIVFRYSSGKVRFPGFRKVFPVGEDSNKHVPDFESGQKLSLANLTKEQKFTQPPARFTEASLIKVMEESGIGRPATYVPTIATLDKRAYIERKGRQLVPTTLGMVVNDMMSAHFPDIVNLEFTAGMEDKLDLIASGSMQWQSMMKDFFNPFEGEVQRAKSEMSDHSHMIREPIGRSCPSCGGSLMKKLGKNGFFIGCGNFAQGCRYTESIPLGICPLCNGNVVKKKSKKGRQFYGCENYATTGCEFTMLDKPAGRSCPKCNSIMGQKVRKAGITLICQNPSCRYTMEERSDENAPEAESNES